MRADAIDLQHDLARRRFGRDVQRAQIAPDHQPDHFLVLDHLADQRADDAAVAQHHDPVAAALDLMQPVRDEDDADAAAP